jgi:predicted small lipoprotein YifL
MISKLINSNLILIFLISLSITACGGKLPGADAKKVSPDPRERVKKNLEEGKGFRLNDLGNKNSGTTYEFASSNELWRASLDVIDFMPLTTANYNGGIIVTDWYSENQKAGESVKITIRFLTNEVRSDALNVKVFYKKCKTVLDCEITETEGNIKEELTKSILKKATIYKKQSDKKNFKKRPDIKD